MADQIIAASLSLNSEQANQSVKSFKQELKESEAALLSISEKFGSTSTQAVEAAKKVANMRDTLGDAKSLVDAFNPDRKFNAFGSAVSGVAGGISSLTGLMGLLGEQSEDTQKLLLKVQSAMAFSQGINQVLELKDTFKQLGAFIQSTTLFQKANNAATQAAAVIQKLFSGAVDQTSTSFKFLKGAIAATGIGLLVLGISEVVSALQSWTSEAEKAAEAQKQLAEQTKKYADAGLKGEMDFINRTEKLEVARAEAAGASEAELFKIRERWQNTRISSQKRHLTEVQGVDEMAAIDSENALKIYESDLELSRLDFQKKEREQKQQHNKKLIDTQHAQYEKSKEAIKQAETELAKLRDENYLSSISDESKREEERIKLDAENERKRFESIKATSKKEAQLKAELIEEVNKKEKLSLDALAEKRAKEEEERAKQINDTLLQLQKAHDLLSITNDKERALVKAQQDYEAHLAEVEQMKATNEERLQLIAAYEQQKNDTIAAINADAKAKQDALKIELDEMEMSEFEKKLADLDNWYKQRLAIVEGNEQLTLQLQESYEKQKTELVRFQQEQRMSIISGILGKAADLFGKQTAAGKALAIAEATMNTYTGATAALRSKVPFPEPIATGVRIAQAGLIIASGIKSIREIAKTKVPGGGDSSVPSITASAPAPLAPQPQASTTTLDQNSINQIGNAAVPQRTFVLSEDVDDAHERNVRLARAARLGG